jgi:hypothetical protein
MNEELELNILRWCNYICPECLRNTKKNLRVTSVWVDNRTLDISVSKVIGYGLHETRVRKGRDFSLRHRIHACSGEPPASYPIGWYRGLFPQGKVMWTECEADHSSLSSVNIKNAWRWAEDGGSMFLRNVGINLQVHTALQPKKSTSAYSPPW